jgi:tetratricopeptide (TPR) repeat protein
MLSESEPAIKSYTDVITYYPGSREAATAAILLEYLCAVDEGAYTVMKLDLAKNEKAEKLYFLSSYGRSIKLFEEYFATAKKSSEAYSRAMFYYARAAEESGNKEAAVAAYRDLAANDNSGEWGAKSDQRMLVLDTFYRDSGKQGEQPPPEGRRDGSGEFADKIDKIQSLVHQENFALQKAESGYGEFLKRNEAVRMASAPEDREFPKLEAGINPGGPEISSVTSLFKDTVEKNTAGTAKKSSGKLPDMVSVITKDGFLFEGELLKTNRKEIVLRSEFGDIPISRSQIKTISKSSE